MKRPIRKRSFLLLEIVISLFLIVLCLFPLVRTHTSIRVSQAKQHHQMKCDPLFQNMFCNIKQCLYERNYSWDQLKKGVSNSDFALQEIKECNKPSLKGHGMLLNITMKIDNLEQTRLLFLEEVGR